MARDGSQPNDGGIGGRHTTSRSPGTLYVISTPIGHPDDITLRALATLRRVAIIASEDPCVTQALLAHHDITATVTSYGPLNRHEKMLLLLDRLMQGQDVALVSDHGTPVIHDPGSLLVAGAYQAGIPVKAIPGASIMTAATAISGFGGDAILFERHLPPTRLRLEQYVSQHSKERRTLVCCVETLALTRLLEILTHILPTRQIAVVMNLTTSRETIYRGRPRELLDQIGRVPKDSAVTVVIEGYRQARKKESRGEMPRPTRLPGGE
ncbi:MAG: SAM-dependent methyltransferase [Nitrospirota bacterium]